MKHHEQQKLAGSHKTFTLGTMVSRVIFILLLVLSFCALPLNAQQTETARRLFKETKARADDGQAQSQLAVGRLYSAGTGVAADQRKAVKYYTKAAQQGLSQAQFELALHYAGGEGVKVDPAEAAYWFSMAAEQGLPEAQVELGRCNLFGKGVTENGVEAVRWFRQAADQGSAAAEFYLGKCYFEGSGVSRDIQEGTKWTQRAAQAGFAPAQNALGSCYERGLGVERDYLQAYKWFALAAAKDDANAIDIRVSMGKVESFLTKAQVAEAQRLAREFTPGSAAPAPESDSGLLTVTAEDGSSEVFADGKFVGNTPAKLNLKPGLHVIEVKQPGYKDYRREINLTSGSDLTIRASLEKL